MASIIGYAGDAEMTSRSSPVGERLARLLPAELRAFVAGWTRSHRRFVGPLDAFDASGASQFQLLTLLGLRESHSVLDVGCGSLRAGRFLILYLEPDRYCGVEPERWLVEAGVRNEIGEEIRARKRPRFVHGREFDFAAFGRTFDFVLASSVFSHASAQQIATCLARARAVMAPDGVIVASFVEGERSYEGGDWVYPGTVAYTPERISEIAAASGFACDPVGWPYVYGANTQVWLVLSSSGAGEGRS